MNAMRIRVAGAIEAPPHRVFAALCDLDAHRDLASPHIEVLDLHGPAGARTGGVVRLNGPLGIRLDARTSVRTARFPSELAGSARTDSGSTGELTWRLEPRDAHTLVTAELTAQPSGRRDALLLRAGGRTWLRRRLATAISRLERPGQGSNLRPAAWKRLGS